jgi:hypothetical protein
MFIPFLSMACISTRVRPVQGLYLHHNIHPFLQLFVTVASIQIQTNFKDSLKWGKVWCEQLYTGHG